MDQRVDMYSSKDPQWVHPKWIQARSDGDSLEIHFNVGEFQAPKRRSNFDQPELNSPKKRIDIDPKTAIAKQFMLGNEKANGDQVEHGRPVGRSEAIARGYPRVESSGPPLVRAAEIC